MDQVAHSFHIKNLGRKIGKFIARCDTCQRVKYPNNVYTTQERSFLLARPGDLCALVLFGALPVARGGVTYILVCHDVFSKHLKLYALKAATVRWCLNKLVSHFKFIGPCIILIVELRYTNLMSLVSLFHHLLLNMFRMLVHPSSGVCE